MNTAIRNSSDIVSMLTNPEYRALTFRAELFPLVGDAPFFVAPPTFAGHEVKVDGGISKHKLIGNQRADGVFPLVELESSEQFSKRLQKAVQYLDLLPPLKIAVDEDEEIDLLGLVHGSTDGFLRESTLDGVYFRETEIGKSLFDGTFQEKMKARYEHFPHRLLTGECDMQSGQSKDKMLVFGGSMWAVALGEDAIPLASPKLGHMPLALKKDKDKYLPTGPGNTLVKSVNGKTIDSYNMVNAGNTEKKIINYHGVLVNRAYVQGSLDFAGLRVLVGLSDKQRAALVALWLIGVDAVIKNYHPRKNAGLRAKSINWNIVPPRRGDSVPHRRSFPAFKSRAECKLEAGLVCQGFLESFPAFKSRAECKDPMGRIYYSGLFWFPCSSATAIKLRKTTSFRQGLPEPRCHGGQTRFTSLCSGYRQSMPV